MTTEKIQNNKKIELKIYIKKFFKIYYIFKNYVHNIISDKSQEAKLF